MEAYIYNKNQQIPEVYELCAFSQNLFRTLMVHRNLCMNHSLQNIDLKENMLFLYIQDTIVVISYFKIIPFYYDADFSSHVEFSAENSNDFFVYNAL